MELEVLIKYQFSAKRSAGAIVGPKTAFTANIKSDSVLPFAFNLSSIMTVCHILHESNLHQDHPPENIHNEHASRNYKCVAY